MTDQILRVGRLLRANGERWVSLVRDLDRGLLTRTPAPHEWSALECLRHAEVMDGVFAGRLEVILVSGGPFPEVDTSVHEGGINETPDLSVLAASHATQRAASLDLIGRVAPADLERTGSHPTLGTVSARVLLNEWVAHDTMHLVQAERALLQAFIPNTGPWRKFFGEYDAVQAHGPQPRGQEVNA